MIERHIPVCCAFLNELTFMECEGGPFSQLKWLNRPQLFVFDEQKNSIAFGLNQPFWSWYELLKKSPLETLAVGAMIDLEEWDTLLDWTQVSWTEKESLSDLSLALYFEALE